MLMLIAILIAAAIILISLEIMIIRDRKRLKLIGKNIKNVTFPCKHEWRRIAQSRSALNNSILLTYICIHCDKIRTIVKD